MAQLKVGAKMFIKKKTLTKCVFTSLQRPACQLINLNEAITLKHHFCICSSVHFNL